VAGITGEFFEKGKPAQTSRQARDDEVARRLWAESERIAGISW
jgi:hypothetical protein